MSPSCTAAQCTEKSHAICHHWLQAYHLLYTHHWLDLLGPSLVACPSLVSPKAVVAAVVVVVVASSP
jgi:hypothetical protein